MTNVPRWAETLCNIETKVGVQIKFTGIGGVWICLPSPPRHQRCVSPYCRIYFYSPDDANVVNILHCLKDTTHHWCIVALPRIVQALDMYGAKANMGDHQSQRIVQHNVALEVWEVSPTDSVIGFASLTSADPSALSNESLVSVLQATDVRIQMTQAAILLPSSALDMAGEISG